MRPTPAAGSLFPADLDRDDIAALLRLVEPALALVRRTGEVVVPAMSTADIASAERAAGVLSRLCRSASRDTGRDMSRDAISDTFRIAARDEARAVMREAHRTPS